MATRGMGNSLKRLRVLISAYACEPGKGSEPGVGWNVAQEMANIIHMGADPHQQPRCHRGRNERKAPGENLHFVYYDLPAWTRWWKKGSVVCSSIIIFGRSVPACLSADSTEHRFRFAHHVTFGKYWVPSWISHSCEFRSFGGPWEVVSQHQVR